MRRRRDWKQIVAFYVCVASNETHAQGLRGTIQPLAVACAQYASQRRPGAAERQASLPSYTFADKERWPFVEASVVWEIVFALTFVRRALAVIGDEALANGAIERVHVMLHAQLIFLHACCQIFPRMHVRPVLRFLVTGARLHAAYCQEHCALVLCLAK